MTRTSIIVSTQPNMAGNIGMPNTAIVPTSTWLGSLSRGRMLLVNLILTAATPHSDTPHTRPRPGCCSVPGQRRELQRRSIKRKELGERTCPPLCLPP